MIDRETDQQQAMEAIEPILQTLYDILDQSVGFYFSDAYSDAARAEHDNRAAANCVYAHAEKRMIAAADSVPGLQPISLRGLVVLNYRDQALARFKKVGANGRHRNYPTKQQRDYDDQAELPGLPPPAVRLTAGYTLDAAGVAMERVMIARPMGRNILWTAQVTNVDGAVGWIDITPAKFGGMDGSDYEMERARRRRGG